MEKSPADVLASCIQAVDAEAIIAARAACGRIAERVRYIETNSGGRICTVANHAEESLFDLLHYAANYGYCNEARNAIYVGLSSNDA